MAETVQWIAIADLILDPDVQPRAKMLDAIVEEYAERMAAGDDFPPLDVFGEGYVADGFYRTLAARRCDEIEKLPCRLHKGGKAEAVWFAAAANATHGLRRTNADKRRAVEHALLSPAIADLSDRGIAAHTHVTHVLVSRVRREMEAAGQLVTVTSSTGKDGKVRKRTAEAKPKRLRQKRKPEVLFASEPYTWDDPEEADAAVAEPPEEAEELVGTSTQTKRRTKAEMKRETLAALKAVHSDLGRVQRGMGALGIYAGQGEDAIREVYRQLNKIGAIVRGVK